MNRLRDHPWKVLALFIALLGGYALAREGIPRGRAVVDQVVAWRTDRARIDAAARWKDEKALLLARRDRLSGRLDALHGRLPDHTQTSVLLQQLQRHADSAGVVLRQIRPGEEARFSTHGRRALAVTLDGRFHEIAAFIDRIERTALVHVRRLDLRSDDPLAPILDAHLDLRLIRLHPSPPDQYGTP